MMKGEHRAYGSTRVKLMVGMGHLVPNDILAKSTRTLMDEEK